MEYSLLELLRAANRCITPPSSLCDKANELLLKAIPLAEQLQAENKRLIVIEDKLKELVYEQGYWCEKLDKHCEALTYWLGQALKEK